MRSTALIVAGFTTLSSLFAIVTPPAYAHAGPGAPLAPTGQRTATHQLAAGGKADRAASRLAPRRCEEEPQKAETWRGTVPAQETFDATKVWPISTGADVTVAVLDSGVDTSHPQLKGANIANGADFLYGNGGGTGKIDCHGQGTAVASLIAAQKVDGVVFQGLAYRAKIVPVIVGEPGGSGSEDKVTSAKKYAQAINWAVKQRVDVITLSVPQYQSDPAVKGAINAAVSADVVVVAAVGDHATKGDTRQNVTPGPGPSPYPAMYDGVIGVGAVDDGGKRLENSQYGEYVDLVAPGNAMAANRGSGHVPVVGTGIAAAFVGATAALVRARWPEMSAEEVGRRLGATASAAAGSKEKTGAGIVDPHGALTEGLSDDKPADPVGMLRPSQDPAELARAEEWEFSGTMALIAGILAVVLAGGMLATLTLLPLGRRRKWRPGRAKPFPTPVEDPMPPAPLKLFEDLETH
ncbi:MAG: S8 family serine peptidase [Micromonosporaceae bacterium]